MVNINLYTAINTTVDVHAAPEKATTIGKHDSQLLFGETFEGAPGDNGWIKGKSLIDGYEGFVHGSELSDTVPSPTHKVTAVLTHIYAQPDFKTRPLMGLSFLSRVNVDRESSDNGFVSCNGLGWVFEKHLSPLSEQSLPAPESVLETAQAFLGTPYLYGGRSALGIDCSGLIQIALLASGLSCPRDSGDQEVALGSPVNRDAARAGDLVFFRGHVGILTDKNTLLNASARTMTTAIEPLDDVAKQYGGITVIKRI